MTRRANTLLMEEFFAPANPQHIKKEKQKAKELRQTQWWKNQLARRVCYYCQGEFAAQDLTMDHVVPIVRGGLTTKSNVVPSCKKCNSEKKYFTPAELSMQQLKKYSDRT